MSVTCETLSSLKKALIKTGNPNWGIDYEFFKGQLKYPQTSTMSSTKDDNLRKRVEMKVAKEAKAFSFMEKNKGLSLLNQHATESKASFSHTMISGDNVLEKKIRQSQCSSKLIPSEDCSSLDNHMPKNLGQRLRHANNFKILSLSFIGMVR